MGAVLAGRDFMWLNTARDGAVDALPGLAGAAAWLVIADGGLSQIGVGLVAGISAGFGMLSSVSRAQRAKGWAVRTLLMNGGAVWIAAFCAASLTTKDPALVAMIGLGVGLAGTRALEVVEIGALTVLSRVSGKTEGEKRQQDQNLLAAAKLGATAALREHDEQVAKDAELENQEESEK
jgi:ribosomal protein L16/L10AE